MREAVCGSGWKVATCDWSTEVSVLHQQDSFMTFDKSLASSVKENMVHKEGPIMSIVTKHCQDKQTSNPGPLASV